MISTKKIRENFSRAAVYYEKYADIQAQLAQELLEELIGGEYKFRDALDIGCGTGRLLRELKKFFPQAQLFGLDISLEMLKYIKPKISNLITADAVSLPFKDNTFDLVLSNAVYQWVFDLNTAFKEAARVLKKSGCFLFNCFGVSTLEELRNCFNIEENYLPPEELIREHLEKANFSEIELKKSVRKKYFDNLVDILSWLKYLGLNQVSAYPGLLTPGKLAKLNHFYCSNFGNNGQVYATFEVINVKARK